MSTYSKSYLECGTSSSKISGSEKNQEKIEYKTYKQQEKTSSNNNFDKSIITFDSDEEDEKENDQINKCFKNIQIQSNSRLKFSIETNKFTKAITTIGRNKFKEDLISDVSKKIEDLTNEANNKEINDAARNFEINDRLKTYKHSQTSLKNSTESNLNEILEGKRQIHEKLLSIKKKKNN